MCPGTGAIVCLVYLLRVTSISRAAVVLVLLCPLVAFACRTYGSEPPATPPDAGDTPSDGGLADGPASDSGRFCEKQPNAVYCADFDGPDFGFGWELRGEDLGRLVRVASTKSLPFALRAELNLPATSPSDSGLVGNVYLLHKLGQPFPGIAVDVDIDTDGVTAASGGTLVTTATVAFSIEPPAFVSLGFSGEKRGVLVVAREVDAGGVTTFEFARPSKGFVHYRLETNFDRGTVSLFADGTLVVPPSPALRSNGNQAPFVTAGAGADPIAEASVVYDNYVVTKLP